MITRRKFLIGTGTTLTFPLANKFVWHLENNGTPLIEAPAKANDILYVDPSREYELQLGEFPDEIPSISWREYIFGKLGYDEPEQLSDFRRIYDDWGVKPHQYDDLYEDYYEHWILCESPNVRAFHLLDALDIGRELRGPGYAVGGLQFIDGDAPGHDYMGVLADDELSISLLQHRLNELKTGIAVEMID